MSSAGQVRLDPWVKIPTTYAAPTEGNFRSMGMETLYLRNPNYGDGYSPDYYEFYIEYLADGQRYIDDNNGSFYRVGKRCGSL